MLQVHLPEVFVLSHEKLKASVFDGPKIRQLLKDKEFIEAMSSVEKNV